MRIWISTLLSVTAVSLVSVVGILTLPLGAGRVQKITSALVSFAVGALLGDAFLHLIPEAFGGARASTLQPSLLVLGGMMLFFAVEKLLRHHHHAGHLHHHPRGEVRRPELAAINLIGDGVHNFIDGVLIAASFLVSPVLGASTVVAVVFHEIPQELGDFGVLLHAGLRPAQAVWLNLASASVSMLGALLTLLVGHGVATVSTSLVPLAAGGFVYIAAADLIPELQHDRSLKGLVTQGALIALGIAVMAGLKLLE